MGLGAYRAFLRLGMFLVLCAVVLLFFVQQGSAEYIATICSLGMGIFLIVGVYVMQRVTNRP